MYKFLSLSLAAAAATASDASVTESSAPDATASADELFLGPTICDAESGGSLDLSSNGLNEFPDCIIKGKFKKKIQVLNLSNNGITSVPEKIKDLKKLRTLDLSDNQITQLPDQFAKLKDLDTLILTGNPLVKVPLSLVELNVQTVQLDNFDGPSSGLCQADFGLTRINGKCIECSLENNLFPINGECLSSSQIITTLSSQETTIGELEFVVSAQNASIAMLEGEVIELDTTVVAQNETIVSLQKENDKLEMTADTQAETIDAQTGSIGTLERKNEKLDGTVQQQAKVIRDLQSKSCLRIGSTVNGQQIGLKKKEVSAVACQKKCQQNKQCKKFTFQDEKCALYKDGKFQSNKFSQKKGIIAGPKKC